MPNETPEAIERRLKDTGGVPVVFGETETPGHYAAVDEVAVGEDGMAEVVGVVETVTVATGILEGLAMDAVIKVDESQYEIRDHRRVEDGRLTKIWLRTP